MVSAIISIPVQGDVLQDELKKFFKFARQFDRQKQCIIINMLNKPIDNHYDQPGQSQSHVTRAW